MAISKKGKRKIIYNEELFFWYIKKDDDYGTDYLNIVKEDRSVVIYYRINQINDEFIHPKITVQKSPRLKSGLYNFFPPLSDEIITSKTVSRILKWHEQTNISSPLKYPEYKFSLGDIDYKSGKIVFISDDFKNLTEDMLLVEYPDNYILDLGWYGSSNGFVLYIIKDENWKKPVKRTSAGYYDLKEIIVNAVDFIMKISL
jgi:hypothetical protein